MLSLFLAIVNTLAISIGDHVSMEYDGKSFGHMPRSDIDESYGRFGFSSSRVLYTDFWSNCTSSQSHK